MNPDIEQLKRQVADLMAWKEQKTRQQISYPLDIGSKIVLYKNMFWRTGIFVEPVGLLPIPLVSMEVKVNQKTYWVLAGAPV